MTDKRRFVRWQVSKEAKVKLLGKENYENCNILDISLKGLRICLIPQLEKDKPVKLSLALSKELTLDIEAEVAWHKSLGANNIYGLYFTKIKDPDKEKIYQFVRKVLPNEMRKNIWRGLTENKEKGDEITEETDKRTLERFSVKLNLRYLDLNSSLEGKAQTCDISAKGISFLTDKALQPKAAIEMWLEVPDQGNPIYSRGEVAWIKKIELNKYRVGINLERADLMGMARILRATL